MRFLRQYQYTLCFLAVAVFSLIMVFREMMASQSSHVQRREEFLVLQERGQADAADHLYQRLIQEFPELSDGNLADDLQRTALAFDTKTNNTENLVWKYHVSVRNELRHRAEHRLKERMPGAEP